MPSLTFTKSVLICLLQMYCVVLFEDQTVATVHRNWMIGETEVKWPRPGSLSPNAFRKLLREGGPLPPNHNTFKIEVVRITGKCIH